MTINYSRMLLTAPLGDELIFISSESMIFFVGIRTGPTDSGLVTLVCTSTPGGSVLKGVVSGAIVGGIGGAVVTGGPGAIPGGIIGGATGAGRGMIIGLVRAGVCDLSRAYGPPYQQ